jgi:ribosomal protein S14
MYEHYCWGCGKTRPLHRLFKLCSTCLSNWGKRNPESE